MIQLQRAIIDEYRRAVALSGLTTGLYMDRAPQEDMNEYIAMHLIDLTPDEEFDYGRRLEVARVQFSIYSKARSSERANEIFDALRTIFDRCVLTFSADDFHCVSMARDMANLMREEDGYWLYAVDYLVMLQPVITTTTTAP